MGGVLCPGSFDPPTVGHVDIITRAAALFPSVTVAVLVNPEKTYAFAAQERVEMLERCISGLPNARVMSFSGPLTECAASVGAAAVVKGLRSAADFEYEALMAECNRSCFSNSVETVMLPARAELGYISSSMVRQVAALGGDLSRLVPDAILERVLRRLKKA